MPQSPFSDLVVTNAGTILRSVDTLQLTGSGVSIASGSPNPRVAVINIPGGGAPTLAAGALLGNPGTVAAAGTDVTVGSGLMLTSGGSLEATGGGGGAYLQLESGTVASKISALPTLSDPPLAPVFLSGITNDGTTATNVQIPQGVIVQPGGASGTTRGLAIIMTAGASTGKYGGGVQIRGGGVTNPGTAYGLQGGGFNNKGGNTTITNAAGTGTGGAFQLQGGGAYQGTKSSLGGGVNLFGGKIANGVQTGGSSALYAQHGDKSGNVNIYCSQAFNGGTNGNIIINPAQFIGSTSVSGGFILLNNLGTVDPHVLNAAWLGVSNGVTLSAG